MRVGACLVWADAVEKLQFLEIVFGKLTLEGNDLIRRDGSREDRCKPPAAISDGLGVICFFNSQHANILSDIVAVPILEFFNSIGAKETPDPFIFRGADAQFVRQAPSSFDINASIAATNQNDGMCLA